jgi:hypothetical protein
MIRKLGALGLAFALAACSTSASTSTNEPGIVGFPAADGDNNRALSVTEFRDFLGGNAYNRFDDNHDGLLSRKEYEEAVSDEYETDAFWHALNKNHNETLNRKEFIDGWFKIFDVDKNGRLSQAEFDHAIEHLDLDPTKPY